MISGASLGTLPGQLSGTSPFSAGDWQGITPTAACRIKQWDDHHSPHNTAPDFTERWDKGPGPTGGGQAAQLMQASRSSRPPANLGVQGRRQEHACCWGNTPHAFSQAEGVWGLQGSELLTSPNLQITLEESFLSPSASLKQGLRLTQQLVHRIKNLNQSWRGPNTCPDFLLFLFSPLLGCIYASQALRVTFGKQIPWKKANITTSRGKENKCRFQGSGSTSTLNKTCWNQQGKQTNIKAPKKTNVGFRRPDQ